MTGRAPDPEAGPRAGAGTGGLRTATTDPGAASPGETSTDDGTGEVWAIAERVRSCRGVVGLSGGPFGTVATYLPGRRLTGVSVDDREVRIAVVVTAGRPLPETADEVRRALADLAGERRVNVRIDDIVEEP
jgi:hypothetical protein